MKRRSENGQALVMGALMIVILMGAIGLALDTGHVVIQRRHAQVAADAAALAGAAEIAKNPSNVIPVAIAQATLNGFTADPSTTVTANHPPNSGPHQGDSRFVEVLITRDASTYFMRVLGVADFSVDARAVAEAWGSMSCSIYVLNTTANPAISGTGSARVSADGCVQVNSSASAAIKLSGSATVHSDTAILVNGGCSAPAGNISPPCATGSPQVADPMAPVPVPSAGLPPAGQPGCSAPPVKCAFSSSGDYTISPGVYETIKKSNSGTLTLNPGIYIITKEFSTSSSARVAGSGVLLYFACEKSTAPYWRSCNSGESGGSLSLTGSGGFTLSAGTGGQFAGLVIYYDVNNTSNISLTGSSTSISSGTVYARKSELTLTGSTGNFVLQSVLVVDTLKLTGSSTTPVTSGASLNYQPGEAAVLVE